MIQIRKVGTHESYADILAKHVDRKTLEQHLENMSFFRALGRHEIMPMVTEEVETIDFEDEEEEVGESS